MAVDSQALADPPQRHARPLRDKPPSARRTLLGRGQCRSALMAGRIKLTSNAIVIVLVAGDVIFAEIRTGLHFDEHERLVAGVGDSVSGLRGDDDVLIGTQRNLAVADRCACGAGYNDPVLTA